MTKAELFIQGYEAAEKELSLTWEDIKEIVRIADGMMNMADSLADIEKRLGIQSYYTEVLTRFKQFKEAKKMTKEEIIQTLYYTLGGLALLKEHFKKFEILTGSYAQHQYQGLSEAEHLAKQYLLELKEDEK